VDHGRNSSGEVRVEEWRPARRHPRENGKDVLAMPSATVSRGTVRVAPESATPCSGPACSAQEGSPLRNAAPFSTPLLLLLTLFSTAACDILGPETPDFGKPEAGDLKVLFIGSSYLAVNDLPGIFEGLAEAAGKQVFVARRVQSGYYLDFFAQDELTTQAIRDQKWDYVVLSGGCQTAAYPDTHHLIRNDWGRHDPYPALRELNRKVKQNHSETVLVYIMPWAFEDGMTWIAGQNDDYFAMQEKIRVNALAWRDSLDLSVAPVGMAWKAVMEWDIPEHYLHMRDWNHPSPRGSFLSAATLFPTVFRESAEEVDFQWALNRTDAEALRRVGSEIVLDSLALWNIQP
jgi:hypothetical protein